MQETEEYSQADYEMEEDGTISFMSLIENGEVGISEIIKIILLFVEIILLSLGVYILVKIR